MMKLQDLKFIMMMTRNSKIIIMMFVAVLLGSCAKNGEYKDCDLDINLEAYHIEADPDVEVCQVIYYENDERIWSKVTLDGVTIEERKTVGDNSYEANYNLDGDTTYFNISHENWIESDMQRWNESEYSYEKWTSEGGSEVELRANFYKRKDISLYRRQYVNGKLNPKYSGCIKQFDENGDYSINAKEVWCDCPNEDLDKYLADLLNTFK